MNGKTIAINVGKQRDAKTLAAVKKRLAKGATILATTETLPNSTERECMNADELATFLGVNRKTVYAYAMRGVIPHRRLGRRIVFSRSQVVSWLANAGRRCSGKATDNVSTSRS